VTSAMEQHPAVAGDVGQRTQRQKTTEISSQLSHKASSVVKHFLIQLSCIHMA
jgi:hypothetical protein